MSFEVGGLCFNRSGGQEYPHCAQIRANGYSSYSKFSLVSSTSRIPTEVGKLLQMVSRSSDRLATSCVTEVRLIIIFSILCHDALPVGWIDKGYPQ